jgi:hypothetical protein
LPEGDFMRQVVVTVYGDNGEILATNLYNVVQATEPLGELTARQNLLDKIAEDFGVLEY